MQSSSSCFNATNLKICWLPTRVKPAENSEAVGTRAKGKAGCNVLRFHFNARLDLNQRYRLTTQTRWAFQWVADQSPLVRDSVDRKNKRIQSICDRRKLSKSKNFIRVQIWSINNRFHLYHPSLLQSPKTLDRWDRRRKINHWQQSA